MASPPKELSLHQKCYENLKSRVQFVRFYLCNCISLPRDGTMVDLDPFVQCTLYLFEEITSQRTEEKEERAEIYTVDFRTFNIPFSPIFTRSA